MKNLVIFSGSGISEESGIPTFRGSDGLWEGHRVEEVATPQAWKTNPQLVLDFYNMRRSHLERVSPNRAHYVGVELAETFNVTVITQNVDDLHERAGSSNIVHLHGELTKARSTKDRNLVYPIHYKPILLGDLCELGSQLRPHIVWFGEEVPMLEVAEKIVSKADYLVVVGTSLQVYPAAGLVYSVKPSCKIFVVDPNAPAVRGQANVEYIQEKAGVGMERLKVILNSEQYQ